MRHSVSVMTKQANTEQSKWFYCEVQGDLLKGIVIESAKIVLLITVLLFNNFSQFQLETKNSFYRQCWPYMQTVGRDRGA